MVNIKMAGNALEGQIRVAILCLDKLADLGQEIRSLVGAYFLRRLNTVTLPTVWLNNQMLEAAGKDIPKDWLEVCQLAKDLTDKDSGQYGFSIRGGAGSSQQFEQMMYMHSGEEAMFDAEGNSTVNDPAHVELLEAFADLYMNATPESDLTNGYAEMVAAFDSGSAAMIFHNLGSYGEHMKTLGEGNFTAITTLESKKGTQAIISNGATCNAVFKDSKNPEAAFRWVAYLNEHYACSYFSSQIGQIPCNKEALKDEWVESVSHMKDAADAILSGNCTLITVPINVTGYTDCAIRYIDAHQENPFFLFLSFLEPHFQNSNDSFPMPASMAPITRPYTSPDLRALGGTSHQHLPGYYGMVKRLDECLGRVQDALKSLGMEKDTILVFTTDHGCHFKTRNGEYKRSCHESSIRLPLAIKGGPFDGGGTIQELISLVDMAPTLLDACGIAVPKDMQGQSFLPLVLRQLCTWRDCVFTQISEAEVGRAIRTHHWKYAVTAPDKDPILDSGSDTYVESALYDLEEDPYELDNLIGMPSHRELSNILKEKLIGQMKMAGEAEPVITDAPWKECDKRQVFPGEELL